MKIKEYLKYVIVGFGSFCAIKIYNYLPTKGVSVELSLILSSVFALAIVYLLELLLLHFPLKFKFFRKILLPESCFEGYWIQAVNNSSVRYYTFLEILYSGNDYYIKAATYLSSGQLYCNWYSTFVKIKPENQEIYYAFDAKLLDSDNAESIKGYGEMRLEEADKKNKGGSGFFTDHGTNPIKCAFRFEELSNQLLKESTNLLFLERRKDLIIKYNDYIVNKIDKEHTALS